MANKKKEWVIEVEQLFIGRNYGSTWGGKVEVKNTCSQLELDLREEHTIIWTSDRYFNFWSMAQITSYLKKVKLKLLKISSLLQNGLILGNTSNKRFVENKIFALIICTWSRNSIWRTDYSRQSGSVPKLLMWRLDTIIAFINHSKHESNTFLF